MEWSIQARSQACQGCGRGFKDQEPLHTLLFDERHVYRRFDVCAACWTAQHSQGSTQRKGFVSHWVSVFTVPPPAAPEPIQRETAESLLRKLVELNDPQHAAACFILAVMLERKRLLKVRSQTEEEGRRILVYEQARSGDVFTIADPNLQLDQLDAVQRLVARLLEHGPSEPPQPPAAPPDVATAPATGSPAETGFPESEGPTGLPTGEPATPPPAAERASMNDRA